jgi:prepilin-type N-terminal cleavage/methylation domain-containing protein
MKRIYRTPGLSGGFSLIEVMIAVVVLATGLLALAALQASLSRSSAESKTRSRVAAMLSARMDELRGSGYDNAVLDPGSNTVTSTADGCDNDATDWIDCPRVQAALGSLTVTQTNSLWTSAVDAGNFTQVANRTGVTSGNPEFIRVTLEASWTGANASEGTHSLAMTSELSALALRDALLPPPPGSNTSAGSPVVRTDNPSGPGVIPIAVGGGDATAASNPRPEVVGKNNNTTVTGTRFDVLTYNGLTGAAVIQRRVETAVIKCQCRLGAGGTNLPEIYRASQWPAIWTGERYDIYTPEPVSAAPGQGKDSGPRPGVDQSPLCQECCRDHFDGTTTGVAKFDPERSGTHDHYTVNGGVLAALAVNGVDYVDSCRVIRVDGFWRTAADMYSRQFGLLATETVSGKQAATGVPDDSDPIRTATNYQTFVKDYLEQIDGNSGTAPSGAQAMFDETARQLNDPDEVVIAAPSSSDYRYLHGRGLYLDYLEEKARQKIQAVLADTGPSGECPTGSDVAECILPYLPFTTVNVTELAKWTASDATILSINSGSLLGANPSQPSGGRTIGVKKGAADNEVAINMSNFGLAASSDSVFNGITGVDIDDAAALGDDAQAFDVGGDNSPPSSGDEFSVRISGATTQDPDVFYSVAAGADAGECLRPNATADYRCATNTDPIAGGSITVSNYWIETTTSRTITTTCYKNGDPTDPRTATDTVSVPTFRDFTVSAVIGATAGVVTAPTTTDKKKSESTLITFSGLAANNLIVVTLTPQTLTDAEQYASITSCSTNGGGNQINDVVWSKPWEQP